MRRRTIEHRLFNAVLLVLAGAGCQPRPATVIREPEGTFTPTTDAPVANEPVVETRPAEHTEPWPPTALTAEQHAEQYCAAYQKSSRVDPSTAKPAPPYSSGAIAETSGYWDATRGVARCTIVRERTEGTIEVTRTPTCCPQGRGNSPCPPSYRAKVPGVKILVEQVELRPDGSLGVSALAWHVTEAHPEQRHNCGRRPEGMRIAATNEPVDSRDVGWQLGEMAELEAASVPAFERLARELAAHGAPAQLVRRARAAMRDEVRHARVLGELAARHGCTPRSVEVPPLPCRTLDAIARENAIEGCVREAYGALIATYQAERAAPELRDTFRVIAADERRHAALAEDVHAWIMAMLGGGARDSVVRAREHAEVELRAHLHNAPSCATLGLPGGVQAVALFDAYF